MAVFDKMPDGECILVGVPTGEALVCHIKERIMLPLLQHVADLSPLCFRRVDSSRVVRASVQQDHATFWSGFKILNHTIEVQTNRIFVVVSILLDLESGVLKDSIVIRPARRGYVDLLCAWIEPFEESSTNAQSSGTRYGLGDGNAVFSYRSRIRTVC